MNEGIKALLRSALRGLAIRDGSWYSEKVAEANKLLPQAEENDVELQIMLQETNARADLSKAEEALTQWVRHLLSSQEPKKALAAVRDTRPAGLEDSAHLNALQARIEDGLRHVDDFDEYRRRYGTAIHYGHFSVATGTVRGILALQHAETAQPGRVLCVGPNDANVERRLLAKCPEARLTCAELSSDFDGVLESLSEECPGRVERHQMSDFYDWGTGLYDFVMCFEVLEHLPHRDAGVRALASFCADGGTVMVSVPVGYLYVEATHANDLWYQHLRSFTMNTLMECLQKHFRNVTVLLGADKTLVGTCSGPIRGT